MKAIKIFTFFLLTFSFFLNAVDKDRLQMFFKDYDASAEKYNWGWERLPYAVEKDYTDIAKFLILHGDEIKSYREYWQTPGVKDSQFDYYYKHTLLTAIKRGYVNLVTLMIQSCEDITKAIEYTDLLSPINRTRQFSPLKNVFKVAMEESPTDYEMVEALLLGQVDVNMEYGAPYYTPLKAAIGLKKLDIAKLLLNHAKLLLDYNANEFCGLHYLTPLGLAVEMNYVEGVALLLSYGADPLRRPPGGNLNSPLDIAITKEYWDIVELLLNAIVMTDIFYE